MKLDFVKMHGAGNDYIYFNCMEKELSSPGAISEKLSDRHFGIGGDGIVMICKSDTADAKMRMFNADGSEGKMCGNAIRCVAKLLYEDMGVEKSPITVETLSGIKKLSLSITDGKVRSVTVDMGEAILSPKKIPVDINKPEIVGESVEIGGREYKITCVSMGNPHCIVYCDDPDDIDLPVIGPLFEKNPLFPEGVNTEFISIKGKNELKMRVWERGSGETLACGTGACAAAVASVKNGYCDMETPIKVSLRGGELVICCAEGHVFLTGGCTRVFDGSVEV